MWRLLWDIVASALIGYFVEHSADFARQELGIAAVRFPRPVPKTRGKVHLVTYRSWVH